MTEISPFLKGEARRQGVRDQQSDTALDALRRAQRAQEAHDRRTDVQLSIPEEKLALDTRADTC